MAKMDWSLTADQEIVFRKNMPYVHSIVQKIYHISPSAPDYNDYVQSGYIGLIRAIKIMDSGDTQRPNSYKRAVINYAIFNLMIRPDKAKKRIDAHIIDSLNKTIHEKSGDERELIHLIPDTKTNVEQEAIETVTFEPILNALQQDAPILYRHDILGETYAQIGDSYGISGSLAFYRAKVERRRLERHGIIKKMRETM